MLIPFIQATHSVTHQAVHSAIQQAGIYPGDGKPKV
jgi:hypothetical protein